MNKIYLDSNDDLNLTIDQNSVTTYYLKPTTDINININTINNIVSDLKFVMVITVPITININLSYQSDCHSNLLLKLLTVDNGRVKATINSRVKEDNFNVVLSQYTKVLNINHAHSSVSPNLFINNQTAVANHGVVISNIDSSSLYYLMSKGIDKKTAQQLIINGFIENEDLSTQTFFKLEG